MAQRGSFTCPTCGEEVPAGAKACPECGADEKTGWSENTAYDGIDLPDPDEMDYEKILEKEGLARPKRSSKQVVWLAVTVALVIAVILIFVLAR